METKPQVLCIGSVLWDIVGRTNRPMVLGADQPGRISRIPGGVAMNIAMALRSFDISVALLTAVGQDEEGDALLFAAAKLGLITKFAYRANNLPTDRYMAIEGPDGLIAALADAHTLEAVGDKILDPLRDGRLGDSTAPWQGPVVLDGNLTSELLAQIADSDMFSQSDLRIAPASPGKADRLQVFLGGSKAMLYVNLQEAQILCGRAFSNSADGAVALLEAGVCRVMVTHGSAPATEATTGRLQTVTPPDVQVRRITGAGDVCMAAHIAAELSGQDAKSAFMTALHTTADYISTEAPL